MIESIAEDNMETKEIYMYKKDFVICLIAALILSACSGGGAASTNIDVTLAEFTFTPNAFTIPAGQVITIHAVNSGTVVHEFVIMKYGTTVGDDYGPEDEPNVYWKMQLDPGKEATSTFKAPTDLGNYQVVCGTKGHFAAGMVGKITVVAGQ